MKTKIIVLTIDLLVVILTILIVTKVFILPIAAMWSGYCIAAIIFLATIISFFAFKKK